MLENIENVVNDTQENVVDSQQTEQVETTSSVEKVEVAERPQVEDKPVQSAEENAKYAQVRREAEAKAAAKAKDDMIAEMYGESHGIYTYADYQKALAETKQREREQAIREEYEAKGLPEELIQELIESKKDREERKKEKEARMQQEKQQAEYAEFFDYFKKENGRDFNSVTDTISQEVWDLVAKGKTLTDAYTYNINAQLKAKVAEYEAKLKAIETNQVNASSTPGSLTGNGTNAADHISFEVFEANKHDANWVKKNFTKINESRTKW